MAKGEEVFYPDGDEQLREMHKAPRKALNDERFSEDLPGWMIPNGVPPVEGPLE